MCAASYKEHFESKAEPSRDPDAHTIILHTSAGTQLIAATVRGRADNDNDGVLPTANDNLSAENAALVKRIEALELKFNAANDNQEFPALKATVNRKE